MIALFIGLAALMVGAALAFVILPLLRHARGTAAPAARVRRLRALDAALAAGVIDDAEYAAKRAAPGAATGSGDRAAGRPPRTAFVASLLVALLLPASALLLYRIVGAPQALDAANLAAEEAAGRGDRGPEMEQAIALLVARLRQHPDDVEGWALLGRAYQATQRASDSLAAFKRAHEQAPGNAAVTVEYAQAVALAAPDHRIHGEARSLLEQVVAADPANQRALWLLGIGDYQDRHYDDAIARWNTLLPLLDAKSDVSASVKRQIAQAEALRDGNAPPVATGSATPPQPVGAAETGPAPAADTPAPAAPRLTVRVALDPDLRAKFDPDATLFVYARAASGPPMPLAIARLKASRLPVTVILDDSMGMLPAMKLSMFPEVVVGARISKSGNALPQSGDLQTLSAPLDVHRSEPIALTIDRLVP